MTRSRPARCPAALMTKKVFVPFSMLATTGH